jgi:uncharacterized protein YbjT (DUF2867 family)
VQRDSRRFISKVIASKKHKVYALTRNAQSPAAQDLRNKGANIVKGDLDDPDSLERAVIDERYFNFNNDNNSCRNHIKTFY